MDELQALIEQIKNLEAELRSAAEESKTAIQTQITELRSEFAEKYVSAEDMDKRAVEANRPAGISPVDGVADTEYRSAFEQYVTTGSDLEVRGLGGADHAEGGALVPVDFENEVQHDYKEENVLRKYVSARGTSRDKVFIPSTAGVTVAWGKNNPTKQKISTDGTYVDIAPAKALSTVDQDTIDDAAVNVLEVIKDELVPAFAESEQDMWINGTGNEQPLGVLKTTAVTSAALKSGVADNLPATDEEIIALLAQAKFGIPAKARKKAIWTLNSNTMARLFTVKDTDGEKLIKNGKMFGTDTIEIIESMPDIAAGKHPILFGDWSMYKVRDRKGMRIKVIQGGDWDANGEKGYLGQLRQGGALANAKAFKAIKCAA
ncbi:TPA: phage major capsid protein [Vibrio parahaemolyticus]|nr:phage major capsid protein [Vibrio parahaemolyticus]HCG7105662.1 phage major capsid protein [Vibrio parahaemolyticus]